MNERLDRFDISSYAPDANKPQAQYVDASPWKVSAACVTGPSHTRRGTLCEDASAAMVKGRWIMAAVCDGAGSASQGGRGATMVASSLVTALADHIVDGMAGQLIRERVLAILSDIRTQLAIQASDEGLDIYAFSTTVVGAVAYERSALFFQIGDGAGLAFGNDGDMKGVCVGRPKEYVNETYFLTDKNWKDSLEFLDVSEVSSFFLTTDGVTPFLLTGTVAKPAFYKPVLEYLDRKKPEETAWAIHRLLGKEQLGAIVADDKTLLAAHFKQDEEICYESDQSATLAE